MVDLTVYSGPGLITLPITNKRQWRFLGCLKIGEEWEGGKKLPPSTTVALSRSKLII